jgi:hypothetical protein
MSESSEGRGSVVAYSGAIVPRPRITVVENKNGKACLWRDEVPAEIAEISHAAPSAASMGPPARDPGKPPTVTMASGYYRIGDKGQPIWGARASCSYCEWQLVTPSFNSLCEQVAELDDCQCEEPHADCGLRWMAKRRKK